MQIMPEFDLGGAEIMAENLSYSLLDEGVNVTIVSLYDFRSPITERIMNKNIPLFFLEKKKGLDFRMYLKLYNLFKTESPDVIHTHRSSIIYAVPAACLARIPVRIHTIHNTAYKELEKPLRILARFFYKFLRVIPVSISPEIKKTVVKEYRLPENRVPMIYNGLNFTQTPSPKRQVNGSLTLLHIGRFTEQKNHEGLLEIFRIVHSANPKTKLQLIGTGHLLDKIKRQAEVLGLKDSVEFLGQRSDVLPYLRSADIFVLPSLWEGMPITLIEAMASGLPIVATNVGGVPDMLTNKITGLITSIDNDAFAHAVLRLVSDSELRNNLGQNAAVAAEAFSAKRMAKSYLELYQKELHET